MAPIASQLAERLPLPDAVTSFGISRMVAATRRKLLSGQTETDANFVTAIAKRPIACHADAANAQHYELPAEFFGLILGPRRKYSCCLYHGAADDLEQAEVCALNETLQHAALEDGMNILELGCGWGSLSLFMAERFPLATITAVSNSCSQREFIEAEAARRGLTRLRVVTADMNEFMPTQLYDRVVSVEMFEHMTNWPVLLDRIASWLTPGGKLFLHVFSHRHASYLFDHADKSDWIAQHFFTGGIMPSHTLIRHIDRSFGVEREWRWSGAHYRRTALDWLANYDANAGRIGEILRDVYGKEAGLWRRRWRLFFLATAGLFGDSNGAQWGISHYRLSARPSVLKFNVSAV